MPKRLDRAAACDRWGAYFRCLADLMGLRDWTITIAHGAPTTPDTNAIVECIEGRKQATIALSNRFLDEMPEREQRQVATHELLHAHLDHAAVLAHKAMGDRYDAFLVALEYGIDGIADAFSLRLPLPSDVTPRRTKPKG